MQCTNALQRRTALFSHSNARRHTSLQPRLPVEFPLKLSNGRQLPIALKEHQRRLRIERHAHESTSASAGSNELADSLLDVNASRKGAKGISTDQNSVDDKTSESGLPGCCDHSHTHGGQSGPSNRVHSVLEWIFKRTGLFQLANVLRENTKGSIAISLLFAVAVLANWQAGSAWLSAQLGQRVCQACLLAVYVIAGIPAAVDLTFDLASLHIDTHVLMTLAVGGTLAIGGTIEGALLLVLFQVAHSVEHKLTERATGDLKSLFDSVPDSATLIDLTSDGSPDMDSQQVMKAADVDIGAHMLVKPGEQVPLDGEIVHGKALVSMQHITGEALPVRQSHGAKLPAGSQNHDGLLVVRSTCTASSSTPARISRMAAEAQASKPELRRWIDDVGKVYSKMVIAATVVSLVALRVSGVPMLSSATQRGAFYRAMGLLTTASPCALVLVPLAYVSAIAAITSRGMLIKGGRVLDSMVACKNVAFDKTGTLTTGDLACTGIISPEDHTSNYEPDADWLKQLVDQRDDSGREALAAAAELAVRSSHPVSQAVLACRKQAASKLPRVRLIDFKLVPGLGSKGTIQTDGSLDDYHVRFGSAKFAAEVLPKAEADNLLQRAQQLSKERVVSVVVRSPQGARKHDFGKGSLVRLLTFQDTLDDRSSAAVADLTAGRWAGGGPSESASVLVTMLTGDSKESAEAISNRLKISDVRSGLSPEDKLNAVKSLRSDAPAGSPGGGVIMVGDGINDTPALAAADVGIAIAASPADAAGSAADIVLLSSRGVAALPFLLAVSRRTKNIVRQNMVLALGSIAALALPVLGGWLPLWVAVSLHEGSTLLVALNSLRLLKWPEDAVPTGKSTKPDVVVQEPETQRNDTAAIAATA